MNLNESDLEKQLRAFAPAQPSSKLAERLEQAMETERSLSVQESPAFEVMPRPQITVEETESFLWRFFRGAGWACAGAAAAFVALAWMEPAPVATPAEPVAATTPAGSDFQYAEASAEVVSTSDEGVVLETDDTPVRQVRYQTLERYVWRDASTGARMEFEVPREDVRLVPVAMQ